MQTTLNFPVKKRSAAKAFDQVIVMPVKKSYYGSSSVARGRRRYARRRTSLGKKPYKPAYIKMKPQLPATEIKCIETRLYTISKTTYSAIPWSSQSNSLIATYSNGDDLTGTDNNTSIRLVNSMPTGDDSNTRDGSFIKMHSLRIEGVIQQGSSQSTSQVARMILVYDASPNGAFPTLSQIFTSAGSGQSDARLCTPNTENRQRFTVLMDKSYTIDPLDSSRLRNLSMYKKLQLPTIYKSGSAGNGSGIGPITQGALYMCLLGSHAYADNGNPAFVGSVKLYYSE